MLIHPHLEARFPLKRWIAFTALMYLAVLGALSLSSSPDYGAQVATRRPLVMVNGQVSQLPSGDSISVDGFNDTGSANFTSTTAPSSFATGPLGVNTYGGTTFEFTDEHMDGTRVSTGTYNGFQTVTLAGTASQYPADINEPSVGNHVGIHLTSMGTATTGSVVETSNTAIIDFSQLASARYEGVYIAQTLSTATDEYSFTMGFMDTTGSINQVDGCYFLYDRGNVATAPGTGNVGSAGNVWQCWCSANSVRTGYKMDGTVVSGAGFTTVNQSVAAGVPPSTNWYHLKVIVTSNTEADFYVNGTLSCKVTSNIPSGSGRLTSVGHAWRKSAGTTALFWYLDWNQFAFTTLAPRTP